MIKRTVEISSQAAHVTVRNQQLLVQREGQTVGSIPCEDLGVLLVDHPGTTYSHAALMSLAESEAVLVICGRDHLPSAILLPLSDHTQIVWRIGEQLSAAKPLHKRLWKQLVQAKVRAQAANLAVDCPAYSKLLALATQVRSGDPDNIEAQAARIYWTNWRPEESFRRDADAGELNSLLNYGYAVLRAAVARAIVAAGLMPAIGLHHANRSNSFCLADDLMEPLRPMVDQRAREMYVQGYRELTSEAKGRLLELLAEQVELNGQIGPLMVNLHRFVGSLVRCFQGQAKRLEIPQPCLSADTDVCGS